MATWNPESHESGWFSSPDSAPQQEPSFNPSEVQQAGQEGYWQQAAYEQQQQQYQHEQYSHSSGSAHPTMQHQYSQGILNTGNDSFHDGNNSFQTHQMYKPAMNLTSGHHYDGHNYDAGNMYAQPMTPATTTPGTNTSLLN